MKSGIYCLDTYMQPCERGMWKDYQEPQGVLVMKDNYGIILPPALPFIAAWGVPGSNDDLITDEDTISGLGATLKMAEVLKDKEYSQRDYPFAYFKGSPAAENALRLEYGVVGKGKWYIPSKEELKMVFFNNWLDEINKCYLTMGLPVLRYGYYWSSIAKKGSPSSAWYVDQDNDGYADWNDDVEDNQGDVLACASFIL